MTKRRFTTQAPQPTAGALYLAYRGSWTHDKRGRMVLAVPAHLRFAAQRMRGQTVGLAACDALIAALRCKVERDSLKALRATTTDAGDLARIDGDVARVEREYAVYIGEYELLRRELEG